MRLEDKFAIVTGAGSGIGRAIACAYAAEGAAVGIVDKNEAALEETARQISDAGGVTAQAVGDVSHADSVDQFMKAFQDRFQRLDVLVNNAGIGWLGTVTDLSEAEWDNVMAVNVKSVFLCSRRAIPWMQRARGGRIINVASVTGIVASAGRAAYCASKGAVVMLTRAMALDCAPSGINVNAICPGVVYTGMTVESLSDPQTRQQKLDNTPLGWLGQPTDIAPAAVYLASADANFVTGTTLVVDGGWSI